MHARKEQEEKRGEMLSLSALLVKIPPPKMIDNSCEHQLRLLLTFHPILMKPAPAAIIIIYLSDVYTRAAHPHDDANGARLRKGKVVSDPHMWVY
jgi:hypothetical protein